MGLKVKNMRTRTLNYSLIEKIKVVTARTAGILIAMTLKKFKLPIQLTKSESVIVFWWGGN